MSRRDHSQRTATRTRRPLLALVALLGAVILSALSPAPAGAEPAIEVIEAGWDGAAMPGTWTPVRVRVTGGDADVRALVEVIVEVQYMDNPQAAGPRYPLGAYGQMISLPADATRELTLWFPLDGQPLARARLSVEGEALAETEVPMQAGRPGWPFVAVLADAPSLARTLGEIELPYQGLPLPLAVAELDAEAVPSASGRLGALTGLVVQGQAASQLTDSQRAVILEWVEGGGHLVLAGGPDAAHAAVALPDGALPVTFTDAEAGAALDGLAEWLDGAADAPAAAPVARFEVSAGEVLAGPAEAPLAWRGSAGLGTVTLLAVDPALEPFASWPGSVAMLSTALEPALPVNPEQGLPFPGQFPRGSMLLQGSVATLPADAHPDWLTVALVLGGFALVAGPLVHVGLRRLDRREWNWAAVPVAAVGVAALLYVAGVQRDGRDLVTNVASYIELGADGAPARQAVAAAFYGPTHEHLTVALPEGSAARAMGGQVGFDPYRIGADDVAVAPPFHVIDGAERRVEFAGGQYGQRLVLFDRTLPDAPRVTVDVSLQGGLIAGTVRNDTGLLLEDAAVFIGGSATRLGSLAPGQSVPVRFEPVASSDPFGGQQPLSYYIFGVPIEDAGRGGPGMPPMMGPGMPEPRYIPDDAETQRRAQLIDQVVQTYNPFGPGGVSLPLTFVAYTEASLVDDVLVAGDHPVHGLTLLRQPLTLSLPPGRFTMPSGLVPGSLVEMASPYGVGGGGNGQFSWLELRAGSVTYEFRPPLPADARIDTLSLTTQQIGAVTEEPGGPGRPGPAPPPGSDPTSQFMPGPAEAGVFQAYNWQAASWDGLPAGDVHALDGARYAGPDGELRVRIEVGDQEVVRFLTPTLTIEGRSGDEVSR